ncbi:MAG: hypothetical protein Q9195_003166 [Heterodermia aff. obscurata]
MDPTTTTRLAFTTHLIDLPIPPSSSARWRALVKTHKTLLDKLAHHEALARDINRTYMDPAGDRNKIYFMWDFGYLFNISPSLENLTEKEAETWDEATGRAAFSKALITDQIPGMLDQMIEQTYPGQNAGRSLEFGEDILGIAQRLDEGVA